MGLISRHMEITHRRCVCVCVWGGLYQSICWLIRRINSCLLPTSFLLESKVRLKDIGDVFYCLQMMAYESWHHRTTYANMELAWIVLGYLMQNWTSQRQHGIHVIIFPPLHPGWVSISMLHLRIDKNLRNEAWEAARIELKTGSGKPVKISKCFRYLDSKKHKRWQQKGK